MVQSLNVRHTRRRLQRSSVEHISHQLRVRQRHPAETHHRRAAGGHHRLRHVGQPFLQVRVAGTDHDRPGLVIGDRCGRLDLAGHAHERVFRREVPVGRREERRSLDVRAVVGAAGCGAHQTDTCLAEHVEQRERLREIEAVALVAGAEGVPIGAGGDGNAHAVGSGDVRNGVEHREPHTDRQRRSCCTDSGDDVAHEAAAVGEVATVATRSIVRGQQLVPQVPVTRLDVDEVEPCFVCEHGSGDEQTDEIVELCIRHHRRRIGTTRAVEQRMPVGGPRRGDAVRSGVATGVCELQPHHLPLGEHAPEPGQLADGRLVDQQLVRIGASVVADRCRLGPHQSRTAVGEALPSTVDEIGGATVGRPVPALHRQDREAVGHVQITGARVADRDRCRQRAVGPDDLVDRERDAQPIEVRRERLVGVELADLRDHVHASNLLAMSASTSRSLSGRRVAPAGVASLDAQPRSWKNIAASCRYPGTGGRNVY